MTKEELEAYDAMMADRDRWRHRAERAEGGAREALAQLDDIRTDDLAELKLGSVATAISKARVALRLSMAALKKARKALTDLYVSDRHAAAMSDEEVLALLVSKEAKEEPIVMERASAVWNARKTLRELAAILPENAKAVASAAPEPES